MAGFPAGGGFPAQNSGVLSELQQSSLEERQAAMQRVGAQAFQQSWFSSFFNHPTDNVVSSKLSSQEAEVLKLKF